MRESDIIKIIEESPSYKQLIKTIEDFQFKISTIEFELKKAIEALEEIQEEEQIISIHNVIKNLKKAKGE